MSMQIQGPGGSPPAELADQSKATGDNRTQPSAPRNDPPASRTGSDQLSLTSQASQLQALESEIANLPEVDTQRVTETQQSIATGTLQIDPARVADKILRFELGL
jgi:negative regulator of flagellin synthesis FlgM